jgi:hypothetical protein
MLIQQRRLPITNAYDTPLLIILNCNNYSIYFPFVKRFMKLFTFCLQLSLLYPHEAGIINDSSEKVYSFGDEIIR